MPAHAAEKYVVYSVGSASDDESSDGENERIVFRSTDYVDLAKERNNTQPEEMDIELPASPIPSPSVSDKWGSYWSKRERCCCFLNFVLTVALVVLTTIIVLVNKGVMDLRPPIVKGNNSSDVTSSASSGISPDATKSCSTPKPPPKICLDESCVHLATEILSRMNISADPCQDFHEYACGGYIEQAHVTWTMPRTREYPELIVQKHLQNIAETLSEAHLPHDTPMLKTLKTIHQSCVGRPHVENDLSSVKEVMDSLGGMKFPTTAGAGETDITIMVSRVIKLYGVSPFFRVVVKKNGDVAIFNKFSDSVVEEIESQQEFFKFRFIRPSDFFYRDIQNDKIFRAYKIYLGDFVSFVMGINMTTRRTPDFINMIDDLFQLQVYINKVLYTEDSANLSDGIANCGKQLSLQALQTKYNYSISWSRLLTTLRDRHTPDNYTLCYVDLMDGLANIISTFSPLSIQRYLILTVLLESEIYSLLPLNTPRFQEVFHSPFSRFSLDSRDIGCVRLLSRFIPMSIALKHRFPASRIRNEILSLFSHIKDSLETIVNDMYWVPYEQKKHLLQTFSGINLRFAWEHESIFTDPLSGNNATTNFSDNFFRNFRTLLEMKNKKYFRGNITVSSFINMEHLTQIDQNKIDLPLAVLQAPLYHPSRHIAAYFGSLGTFLAQALSEVFNIDVLIKLLTEDKLDHRVALTIAFRIQCLVDLYNDYPLLRKKTKTYKVRGDLTKSENFKDSLALRVAYSAYKSRTVSSDSPLLPGLQLTDDQIFFITYAQTMCEKSSSRGKVMFYRNTEESHRAPGKYRIIGTLSNFKEFAKVFQCRPDTKMATETECSLF